MSHVQKENNEVPLTDWNVSIFAQSAKLRLLAKHIRSHQAREDNQIVYLVMSVCVGRFEIGCCWK